MIVLFVLLLLSGYSWCYNILGLFPYPARSHFVAVDKLLVELSKRGHNVSVYTCYPKKYTLRNYRDIDISTCFVLPNQTDVINSPGNDFTIFSDVHDILGLMPTYQQISTCQPLLELRDSDDKYDLMITQFLVTDFFTFFAWKLNVPFISFMPDPPYPWAADRMGLPNNPSYLTNLGLGFPSKMNFWQRLQNAVLEVYSLVVMDVYGFEEINRMGATFFGQVLRVQDVLKTTNLMFFYTHPAYYPARPMVPNTIDVHGLHIEKKKPISEV